MLHIAAPTSRSLDVQLRRLGISGDLGKVVPRQIVITQVPGVIEEIGDALPGVIAGTVMGFVFVPSAGTIRFAITGAMGFNAKPIKYAEHDERNGNGRWTVVYHDPNVLSFKANVSFGPTIGF
ncbi:MAG: hypothetical protein V1907_01550 [Candidatus Kerfeldbacteria bacterium]